MIGRHLEGGAVHLHDLLEEIDMRAGRGVQEELDGGAGSGVSRNS